MVMVAFDRYTGPPYYIDEEEEVALRNEKAKLVVPILRVRQDYTLKGKTCSRTQFRWWYHTPSRCTSRRESRCPRWSVTSRSASSHRGCLMWLSLGHRG